MEPAPWAEKTSPNHWTTGEYFQYNVFKVHFVTRIRISSFLRLSNILSGVYITVCLTIHLWVEGQDFCQGV